MSIHWRILCLSAFVIGCNQAGNAPIAGNSGTAETADAQLGQTTVSIEVAPLEDDPTTEAPAPQPGTAGWLLQEIQRIRVAPLPGVTPTEAPAETGADAVTQTNATAPSQDELQDQLSRSRTVRRERNEQIVKLATEAIALTVNDPKQEAEFLAAVAQLLDAQLQLALQGDQKSIEALYDAADAFYRKKAESPAAAAAQLALVSMAHAHAMRYGQAEPQWMQEFSRQAQLYVTRFPGEQQRSLPLLMAAGKTCELHGLMNDARSCYSLVPAKFPQTPQALACESVLRRLNLVGKPLEFAGPTLDGNFVNVNEYPGKAVIIVFWASHVKPFQEQVAQLQAIGEKYKKYAQVLSVSLDEEEGELDAFLEKTKLAWPVIFQVEPEKRGWNAPLASYYGVSALPAIWIVDPKGTVADIQVTAETLEPKLRDIMLKYLNKTGSSAEKTSPKPGVSAPR